MPSKPGFRNRLKGVFSRSGDASKQELVIQQGNRHEQTSASVSLGTSSTSVVSAATLPKGSVLPTESGTPATSTTSGTLSASTTSATPTTVSTLPASTSSIPSLPERLWDRAYDDLKLNNNALVQAYEKILSSKLGGTNDQNIIAQTDTRERRNQMRQLIHEGLDRTATERKVKEAIGTATEFISLAKDIISSAIQVAGPQAALPWGGVCVALEILQNPIEATKANCDGIEYVIKRMNMYWKLSGVVLRDDINDDNLSGIRHELGTQVIDLYKALLLYEIKSVCSYNRNRGVALLRDLVGLDDWNGDIRDIKEAEHVFHDDFAKLETLEIKFDLKRLIALAETQSKAQLTNDDQQCIRDLRLSDPTDDKKRIEQTNGGLLQGSFTWILDNSEYQQWQKSDDSRLLWIESDPGKGKTMLLCGIIDELDKKATQLHRGVSYFFCQATDQHLNNAIAVLRGLIFMLVKQQPSLIIHLRKKYKDAGSKLFEESNTWVALEAIFTAIIQDPTCEIAYLAVDALDECIFDREKLLDLVVDTVRSNVRVKWIVSSRIWPQIDERLRPAEKKIKLSLESHEEPISFAVNFYIEKKVHELSKSKEYDEKTKKEVRDYLLENAENTFLWVALVCQNLLNYKRWKVLTMLRTFPRGLESLYKRMMEMVTTMNNNGDENDVKLCKQILAVMMSVYRPVTLQELGCLIEIPEELSTDIGALRDIVALCGSFLTIREDTVYFVHQSAKDHLSTHKETDFPSGSWNVHHIIFSLSLQAMGKALKGKKNIYKLPYLGLLTDDGFRMSDVNPLAGVRYSCIHWVDHLREGFDSEINTIPQNALDDDGVVDSFLREDLLCWLEALSLLRHASAGVTSIIVLEELLKTHELKGQLLRFLHDIRRFVLYNRRAIEMAPLQTYSSALAFLPMQSPVREIFHGKLEQWIEDEPPVEDNWSPCLQTLEGHIYTVHSVAFSADCKLIASGSGDQTIKIWNTATGVCIQTMKENIGSVNKVVFLADNLRVVSGSSDMTVKIWNTSTGMCEKTLEGHTGAVLSLAVLSNDQIVSASADQTMKIWDPTTGDCVKTLEGHGARIKSVAISATGQIVSGSDDKTIKIWDIATGVCVKTLQNNDSYALSVATLNSQQVVIASEFRTIKIWNIATGACTRTLIGHNDAVLSVAVLATGQIVSGSADQTIKIWDPATNECIGTLKGHDGVIYSVATCASATGQIASGSKDKTIRIWNMTTNKGVQRLNSHNMSVWSMALSPDRRKVATGSPDNTIKLWNVQTGECYRTVRNSVAASSIVFLKRSEIASAAADFTIKIWFADDGFDELLKILRGHSDFIRSIASSADGKYLASGSVDMTAKVWDVDAGRCLHTLKGHGNSIDAVTLSIDGKQLASGSRDTTIKIWDVATETCTHTLEGHTGTVTTVAFSADDQYLTSGSDDKTVKVWSVASGVCIQTLDVGIVHHLSFDPSNNTRIYSSLGTLDVDLDPGDLPNKVSSHHVALHGYGIDQSHEWITKDGKPMLWLPPEYRPRADSSTVRITGSQVIIGCESGRVFRMKFSETGPVS